MEPSILSTFDSTNGATHITPLPTTAQILEFAMKPSQRSQNPFDIQFREITTQTTLATVKLETSAMHCQWPKAHGFSSRPPMQMSGANFGLSLPEITATAVPTVKNTDDFYQKVTAASSSASLHTPDVPVVSSSFLDGLNEYDCYNASSSTNRQPEESSETTLPAVSLDESEKLNNDETTIKLSLQVGQESVDIPVKISLDQISSITRALKTSKTDSVARNTKDIDISSSCNKSRPKQTTISKSERKLKKKQELKREICKKASLRYRERKKKELVNLQSKLDAANLQIMEQTVHLTTIKNEFECLFNTVQRYFNQLPIEVHESLAASEIMPEERFEAFLERKLASALAVTKATQHTSVANSCTTLQKVNLHSADSPANLAVAINNSPLALKASLCPVALGNSATAVVLPQQHLTFGGSISAQNMVSVLPASVEPLQQQYFIAVPIASNSVVPSLMQHPHQQSVVLVQLPTLYSNSSNADVNR